MSTTEVIIRAGDLQATFLPDVGMLGTSLRYRGEEFLALPDGVDAYRAGHQTGLALLAPWANRLGDWRYSVAGIDVDLAGLDLGTDENGLPIHGTMTAAGGWKIVERADSRVRARFDYGATATLLRPFPFPHELELAAAVDATTLTITTTLRATGDRAVPVAFGWHPYLRLPAGERREWRLLLPDREHLELDARSLPTGTTRREAAESEPIGQRTFDDLYALTGGRELALECDGRRLAVVHDQGYPYAQVYAPAGRDFICLEPMTAPTNALLTGRCPLVAPRQTFTARYSVTVT